MRPRRKFASTFNRYSRSIGRIRAFLNTVRNCVDAGRADLLAQREKNRKTLLRLEMTSTAAIVELKSLEPEDWVKGPDRDDEPGRSGFVWTFVKSVSKVDVYIKLKVLYDVAGHRAICISFHEAEYAFVKPLK